jgi:type IV fimbrial biogenesis protein FimT
MSGSSPHGCRQRGFTVVELMVVIAITAIAVSMAVPSFTTLMAKKRVEGVTSELSTDLQYARSEAVSRNLSVRVTFIGTDCYVIHPASVTASCTTTTNNIKTVQLVSGSTASFSPNGSPALSYIEFDPVRGIAAFSTASTSGSVNVNSSVGTAQLQAYVSTVGRVCIASPSGIAGYPASCP